MYNGNKYQHVFTSEISYLTSFKNRYNRPVTYRQKRGGNKIPKIKFKKNHQKNTAELKALCKKYSEQTNAQELRNGTQSTLLMHVFQA